MSKIINKDNLAVKTSKGKPSSFNDWSDSYLEGENSSALRELKISTKYLRQYSELGKRLSKNGWKDDDGSYVDKEDYYNRLENSCDSVMMFARRIKNHAEMAKDQYREFALEQSRMKKIKKDGVVLAVTKRIDAS